MRVIMIMIRITGVKRSRQRAVWIARRLLAVHHSNGSKFDLTQTQIIPIYMRADSCYDLPHGMPRLPRHHAMAQPNQ